jgi:hypothetical protein
VDGEILVELILVVEEISQDEEEEVKDEVADEVEDHNIINHCTIIQTLTPLTLTVTIHLMNGPKSKLTPSARYELIKKRKPKDSNQTTISAIETNNDNEPNTNNNSKSNSTAFGRETAQNSNQNINKKRRFASAITISQRYSISRMNSKINTYKDFVSSTEIDNHADTHCFGKNITPIYWNNFTCDVSRMFIQIQCFSRLNHYRVP